jgi:hypothetical protein
LSSRRSGGSRRSRRHSHTEDVLGG